MKPLRGPSRNLTSTGKMCWALERPGISAWGLLMLMILADRTDQEGEIRTTIAALSVVTRMSGHIVMQTLRRLNSQLLIELSDRDPDAREMDIRLRVQENARIRKGG